MKLFDDYILPYGARHGLPSGKSCLAAEVLRTQRNREPRTGAFATSLRADLRDCNQADDASSCCLSRMDRSTELVDDQRSMRVRRRVVPSATTASSIVPRGSSGEGTKEIAGLRMRDSRSGWRRISSLMPERSMGADASNFVRRCAASRVSNSGWVGRAEAARPLELRDGLSSAMGIAFPLGRVKLYRWIYRLDGGGL